MISQNNSEDNTTAVEAAYNVLLWRRSISRTLEDLADSIIMENSHLVCQQVSIIMEMSLDDIVDKAGQDPFEDAMVE